MTHGLSRCSDRASRRRGSTCGFRERALTAPGGGGGSSQENQELFRETQMRFSFCWSVCDESRTGGGQRPGPAAPGCFLFDLMVYLLICCWESLFIDLLTSPAWVTGADTSLRSCCLCLSRVL